MAFKFTLIIIYSVQLLFAVVSMGVSAGLLARVKSFPSSDYLDHRLPGYLVGLSVLTILAVAALLVCRCCTAQQNRAIHISTIAVSVIWTILWLAAIARLVAVGGVNDKSLYYGVRTPVSARGYFEKRFVPDPILLAMSKTAFSFGFFQFLLWLATSILAGVGLAKTTGAAASPQVAMQPQAYKGGPGEEVRAASYPRTEGPASYPAYPRSEGPATGMAHV